MKEYGKMHNAILPPRLRQE